MIEVLIFEDRLLKLSIYRSVSEVGCQEKAHPKKTRAQKSVMFSLISGGLFFWPEIHETNLKHKKTEEKA